MPNGRPQPTTRRTNNVPTNHPEPKNLAAQPEYGSGWWSVNGARWRYVHIPVRRNVHGATWGHVDGSIWRSVYRAIWRSVYRAIRGPIHRTVWRVVYRTVRRPINGTVRRPINRQRWGHVYLDWRDLLQQHSAMARFSQRTGSQGLSGSSKRYPPTPTGVPVA